MEIASKEQLQELRKKENEYFKLIGRENIKDTARCQFEGELVKGFSKSEEKVAEAIEKLTVKIEDFKKQQEQEILEKTQKEEQQKLENQKLGLCELIGTEKQVAWANKLRKQLIEKVDRIKEQSKQDKNLEILKNAFACRDIDDCSIELIETAIQHILSTKNDAIYYIDTRYSDTFDILADEIKEMEAEL